MSKVELGFPNCSILDRQNPPEINYKKRQRVKQYHYTKNKVYLNLFPIKLLFWSLNL